MCIKFDCDPTSDLKIVIQRVGSVTVIQRVGILAQHTKSGRHHFAKDFARS